MLNLARIRTFREVAERGSFSAAAGALGYTQSSVSQQVAVLERELGVTLLDRASRPIAPTPAGRAVLLHAETLLGHASAIERELGALSRGEAGVLRLGGFFTAWATFMPAAVAQFSRAQPGVQLELRQVEPEPALRAIRAGELDVAVVYRFADPDPAEEQGLSWMRLCDDPYAAAVPAGHELARREALELSDLADERWVCPPAGTPYTQLLMRLCHEHGGFTPEIGFETGDIALAQPLVAAGLCVAMLPALGLVPQHHGVAIRPLVAPIPPARSVWAVQAPFRRLPLAQAIVACLERSAGRAARGLRVARPPVREKS